MKKRNHPRHASPSAVYVERSSTTLLYILLTIACAAFLATGFFFAARQHFAAMDLGMKNSNLRKQIEEMEAQNRQLLLAREIVRSPAEMRRVAMNKGFKERDLLALQVAASDLNRKDPLVVKTSMVSPSNPDRKPVKAFLPRESRPIGHSFESKEKSRFAAGVRLR